MSKTIHEIGSGRALNSKDRTSIRREMVRKFDGTEPYSEVFAWLAERTGVPDACPAEMANRSIVLQDPPSEARELLARMVDQGRIAASTAQIQDLCNRVDQEGIDNVTALVKWTCQQCNELGLWLKS